MNGEAPGGPVLAHDVVFVGTGFDSRVALLSAVDWSGIDLGLYGAWGEVGQGHPLAPSLHPGLVDNARAGALYRKARIGLNLYRATGGPVAESLNPRAYELAADGVFTIAQPRAEQTERFNGSIATFTTAGELEERDQDAPGRRLEAPPHGRGPPGPGQQKTPTTTAPPSWWRT